MSDTVIQEIAPRVHVVDAKQRYMGLEMGARMTLLTLKEGILVHSPVAIEPTQLAHLGTPRWVLAPNLLHHLYVGGWADAGIDVWAAQGLPEKRQDVAFAGVIDTTAHPFGDEIEVLPMRSFSMTNEVVVLHRPSRTLIVTDLVFNIARSAPWMTRFAMRCLCGYPGCRTTLVERLGMRREIARDELAAISAWGFDRLIMAHGQIVEQDAKQALVHAFRWLNV